MTKVSSSFQTSLLAAQVGFLQVLVVKLGKILEHGFYSSRTLPDFVESKEEAKEEEEEDTPIRS